MKGLVYELQVSNSTFEAIHGQYFTIQEVFMPDLGIAVNRVNIFKTTLKRYERKKNLQGEPHDPKLIDEIYLSEEEVTKLVSYIDKEKEQNATEKWLKEQLLPKIENPSDR